MLAQLGALGHEAQAVEVHVGAAGDIDQFEEVITTNPVDHDAKVGFFADLGTTLRDRSLWALFSMREDFVAELDPYARNVPTRFATRFRLDLLNVDQVRWRQSPARRGTPTSSSMRRPRSSSSTTYGGCGPNEGRGLWRSSGATWSRCSFQVTCRRSGRDSATLNSISIDDIESAGDVNEALAGYYAASVAAVAQETGVPERALRDWFEQEFVTAQGFRGQVLGGPEAAADADGQVLELLTAAHLLRAESRRGAIWYELAHDRLTLPIEEDNASWRVRHLSDVERRASEWDQRARPDRLLMGGPTSTGQSGGPQNPNRPHSRRAGLPGGVGQGAAAAQRSDP